MKIFISRVYIEHVNSLFFLFFWNSIYILIVFLNALLITLIPLPWVVIIVQTQEIPQEIQEEQENSFITGVVIISWTLFISSWAPF